MRRLPVDKLMRYPSFFRTFLNPISQNNSSLLVKKGMEAQKIYENSTKIRMQHHETTIYARKNRIKQVCQQNKMISKTFNKKIYDHIFCLLHYKVHTECPIDMLTTSDSILQFLKPHISKSKTCFENLVKKIFQMAP